MYSYESLKREIGAKVEAALARNVRQMHPAWIAQEVMADHSKISGADAAFYQFCSRQLVRDEVRLAINKSQSTVPAKQLTLPGMQHLQHYYVVERKGEQVAVRLDRLTNEEIERKAHDYDRLARACSEHADELRRYGKLRAEWRQPKRSREAL